ncbi:hypothetical protein EVJ58_g9177 [Rhodofomes roseus]|uniref:Uncharacterized protein n=1 Tax=Rhodofomes roseus TaxID=34475 RepID=A0A4Y9XZ81_9APHY|nr:hypothetical protein EVJ58_g9177 [Rhodofomes roseus]
MLSNCHPQLISNFVSWAKLRKLDASVQIKCTDGSVIQLQDELQTEFREQFTPSILKEVNETIREEFKQFEKHPFNEISMEEITEHLADTSNTLVGGEDHVNWEWCKHIFRMVEEVKDKQGNRINMINWGSKVYALFKAYYNACIQLHKFPDIFKRSITVVIPKPNKLDYSKAKAY